MERMTAEEAGARLPELVRQLVSGEEIIIEIEEGALLTLRSHVSSGPFRKAGSARGQFWISDDFDEPLEDFAPYTK